jgi:hypothetical protein
MLVLMLDHHFKKLQIIIDVVGLESIVEIAIQYDYQVLLPLLLIVYNWLTPTPRQLKLQAIFLLALGVFGSLASREETTMGLLKIELTIFQCS